MNTCFVKMSLAVIRMLLGFVLFLLASLQLKNLAIATNRLSDCPSPRHGRYVVFGHGKSNGRPFAALTLEEWKANGSVYGNFFTRSGKDFNQGTYQGRWKKQPDCTIAIDRDLLEPISRTWAVVDQGGVPRFSISSVQGSVLTMRYVEQGVQSCSMNTLNGLIVSQQNGLSFVDGEWLPNVVVQSEVWDSGSVRGLALTSSNGRITNLPYSGNIDIQENCIARMTEQNSLDEPFNYVAIVLANGGGYVYLQTDENDLTLGFLSRE